MGRPQPKGPKSSSGASLETLMALRSLARAQVANEDWPKKWSWIGPASLWVEVEPSSRAPPKQSGMIRSQ